MNDSTGLTPALILKSFAPYKNKVIILHRTLGKISCIYSDKKIKSNFCVGSLIFCAIEQEQSVYILQEYYVHFIPLSVTIELLSFIHDIVRICLQLLPFRVAVLELFDFIWYIYQNLYDLSFKSQQIILLRIFLLFDLLPEDTQAYYYAQQDPCKDIAYKLEDLTKYVQICWHRFNQQAQQ